MIHNIELHPGKGGQMVRSAGNGAQLMAKEGKYATLRLPSGEMRMVPICMPCFIGGRNGDHNLINIGKAGRKRTWVSDLLLWFRNEPESPSTVVVKERPVLVVLVHAHHGANLLLV